MTDIVLIGAGPAALSLAASAGALGLRVTCVAPCPEQPWVQNYGAWQDELPGLPLSTLGLEAPALLDHAWPETVVHLDGAGGMQRLGRGYVRLSTTTLQAGLLSRCAAVGVEFVEEVVTEVRHDASSSWVGWGEGQGQRQRQGLAARLVVDAAGHGAGFLARRGEHAPAWQVAYGQHLRVAGGHPWPEGEMVLMDFRPPPAAPGEDLLPPTFLYVMPLDGEHVFVEETVLITRAVRGGGQGAAGLLEGLRAQMWARLGGLGVERSSAAVMVQGEERCVIRMLGAEPAVGQRLLGFGAAAGMVHPATGYLVARVLREAPQVASAVASALGGAGSGAGPEAAAAGWAALWPAERRRQWALYGFGAELLCGLDRAALCAFFAAFFALPAPEWRGFLSADLPPAGLARAMARMFSRATPDIRRRLVAAGASRRGVDLLREMVLA